MGNTTRMIIIGGGVGGYPAAIRAARMGADVTLIEKDRLGGTCLNRGCIPTKALLRSADVIHTMKISDTFGIRCKGYEIDFEAVMTRKDAVVSRLTQGVKSLLAARKIKVVTGTASFIDAKTIQISETGEKIEGDAVLIATGSRPGKIPVNGVDGPGVMDSNRLLEMKALPKSVVVIGGGVIGIEFAQFLNAMGTTVTVIEMMPHLAPGLDGEIARILEKLVAASGVNVIVNASVKNIAGKKTGHTVTYSSGNSTEAVDAEKVLLAVGRTPDFSLLNVDAVGIRHEKGAIAVNAFMETNIRGIYAAGDVVGGMMLAHLASAEGECAVRNALGSEEAMSYKAVPSCIYTSPEVACVGMTEERARESHEIRIGRFPFRGNGKALILDETEGLVKIVSDRKDGEVLGVHILGPHATDMIGEAVLGMNMEMTAEELARSIHPHPTLSEAVMESAMTVTSGAVHLP